MITATDIRQIVNGTGWTQAQLANRVGVTQPTVSRWLTGDQIPDPCQQEILQEILQELKDGPEPPSSSSVADEIFADFDHAVADRLRMARIAARYERPTDAAKALGVPYQTYYAHEIGRRAIDNKTLLKYAKKFRTTAAALLGERPAVPITDAPCPSGDPAEEVAEHIQIAFEAANLEDDAFSKLLELVSEVYAERLDAPPGISARQARAFLLRSHIRRFLKSKSP